MLVLLVILFVAGTALLLKTNHDNAKYLEQQPVVEGFVVSMEDETPNYADLSVDPALRATHLHEAFKYGL